MSTRSKITSSLSLYFSINKGMKLPIPTDGSKILIFFFPFSSGKSLTTEKAISFRVKNAEFSCLLEFAYSAI